MIRIKKMKLYVLFVIFIFFLSFQSKPDPESIETALYDGKSLIIGIIGKSPEVREEHIKFDEIAFSDLENKSFETKYNAIFITKDNLSEAAEDKYVSIYKESKIPFFFIQTEKSYIPFINEDLSYEEVENLDDLSYAIGIIYDTEKLHVWGIGLMNNLETEASVKEAYTQIFKAINKNMENPSRNKNKIYEYNK